MVDLATENKHISALRHLPDAMNYVLELEPRIVEWSERLASRENSAVTNFANDPDPDAVACLALCKGKGN